MKIMNEERSIHKVNAISIFAVFYSFAQILNGYASGIGSLSVAMVLFIVFIFVALFKFLGDGKININQLLPLLFFLILSFNTVIQGLRISGTEHSFRNTIFYVAKFGIWAISISIMSKCLMNYSLVRKWLKVTANISAIYIIIQYLFMYGFHVVLPSLFTFGLLKPNYDIYEGSQYGVTGFRPSALFAEPAFLASFMLLNLVLVMFEDENSRNKWKELLLYTLTIFLSTSSGGIYIAIIVWSIFFLVSAKGNMKILAYSILTIVVVLGFLIFNKIDWNNIGTSVFGNTMKYALFKFQTLDTSGRVGKSFAYLDVLSTKDWIFGVGVGNEISYITKNSSLTGLYMNSITQLICWGGVLGAILFVIMNGILFFRTNSYSAKVLIFVYILYGYFSGMYFSLVGMIYLMSVEMLINKECWTHDIHNAN